LSHALSLCLYFAFEKVFANFAWIGLELMVLLPLLPELVGLQVCATPGCLGILAHADFLLILEPVPPASVLSFLCFL
jgi:hypothetical protein